MALKEQVANSFKWNTANVIVVSLVQILRMSVLSRILEVSDFGLMAIALMVISFIEIFSDLGFTVPLISKQNISNNEYSSVFWFNLLLSVIIYIILFACASIIAAVYDEPSLTDIIRIIGISIIINAFGKLFQTIKTKELCFKYISIVSIVTALLGFAITLWLALIGLGVFSLVYGTLVQISARQAVYLISGLKDSKISLHFSWNEISTFVKLGSYQVGAQILDFLASKIDIILLGKFVGMDDLGIYNLAKELILKITTFCTSLSRTVMTPAIAKIQNDNEQVKSVFTDYSKLFAICTVPIFACVCIFSDEISMIMYGDKWVLVSKVLMYLSIYGIFNSLTIPGSTLQLAYGRTDLSLYWTIIICAVGSLITIIAAQYGFICIVYSQVLIGIFLFCLSKPVILDRIIRFSIGDYLSFSFIPIAYCTVFGALIMIALRLLPFSFASSLTLFIAFCLIYMALLFKSNPRIIRFVIGVIKK